jgi:hypothetical protein
MNERTNDEPAAGDVSDEVLMAYADGDLDPVQAARVERAVAADERLAARVAMFRATAQAARAAFAPDLQRPVPAALRQAVDVAAARRTSAASAVRAASDARAANDSRWALAAAVAAFAAGVVATLSTTSWLRTEESMALSRGVVVAATEAEHIALLDVLSTLPSGSGRDIARGVSVQVLASFVTQSGDLCRELLVQRAEGRVSAVACRVRDRWTIPLALRRPHDAAFAPAAGDGPVDTFLRSVGATAPLSAGAERTALELARAGRTK